MPSNASLQHSGMLPSSVTSQPILPAGPSGPHGKPGPPGEQGQMHERLEQPMDQVGSHSPDGHEAMTTESLLKETEDGTEDETDEGGMDEQGIMRIKPGAVKDKRRAKTRRKQQDKKQTKDPKPTRPAWHDWHASKQT